MKLLLKLYLLGQLIALPFMVGALGNAFSDSSGSPTPQIAPQVHSVPGLASATDSSTLCDSLNGPVANAVQDDIQQLRYITSNLYDEDLFVDCNLK